MSAITSELKDKLSHLPEKQEDFLGYFESIANLLMNQCVISISKDDKKYEIVELEFYLHAPCHPDVITYPRNTEAGRWFFHQSGVDLTFKSTDKQYGGILIRGLREIGSGKLILGPLKCVDELWNDFNVFKVDSFEYPVIEAYNFGDCDKTLKECPRWIPLNRKTVKESGSEQVAKELRISSLCKNNHKYVIANHQFMIGESSYTIDAVVRIVFDSCYRFLKLGSIDKTNSVWMNYNARIKD